MAEKKGKKKTVGKEAAAPQSAAEKVSVCDLLRQTREEKNLTVEDVSSALHIRTAQLRAIETGELDDLPGMTYAAGFVKSYANFLKLDGIKLSRQFRKEHGSAAGVPPELKFPEPIDEGKVPNTIILGVSAACAVVLLILWAVFSGGSATPQIAGIPPVPVVQPTVAQDVGMVPLGGVDKTAAPTPDVKAAPADPAARMAMATPQTPDVPAETPPIQAKTQEQDKPVVAENTQEQEQETPLAARSLPAQDVSAEVMAPVPVHAPAPAQKPDEEIEIHKTESRIVLKAVETSWVEIDDAHGKTVMKKVMHPGEEYDVPNQRGLALITSNAGGFNVYVDGKKVQNIGSIGEIKRGVVLDPDLLKIKRVLIRGH